MKSHRLTRLGRLLLGASLLACFWSPAKQAEAGTWSFSTGVDYTSGDYGEDEDTTIYQVPFSTAYHGDGWAFALTVPYVDLEGTGNIIPGSAGGAAGGGGGGASAGIGLGGIDLGITLPGAGPSPAPVPPAVPTVVDEQGLGDATIAFSFAPFADSGLTLGLGARLPTGDEEKSLGAGQVIGSVGASYVIALSDMFSVSAGVGYGHAFETDEGGVFGGVGAQVDVSSSFNLGASVDWSESVTEGLEDATTATIYAGLDMGERTQLVGYVAAGLTDTSPETGAGVRLIFRP